jgi:hypothetical protein
VSRAVVVAAVVALLAAISTSDREERKQPQWYGELCSQVSTC